MTKVRMLALFAIALLVLGACGDDGASEADSAAGSETAESAGGDCEEGVVETDSGLKYEDVECGDGDEAARGDSVSVKYAGTFENGKEFDSGVYPFQLGSGMVIAGWDEGIVGMTVGGKRKLTIPPDLAYGPQGRPGIPPNSTLIFDVELLEITKS